MILHHPRKATLAAYVIGDLSEAVALVLAAHLTSCAACRHDVSVLEEAHGTDLIGSAPEPLRPGALHQMLQRLEAALPPPPPLPVRNPELPPPLDRVEFGRWWRLSPNLRWRPLRVAGSAWGGLLQVRPGGSIPPHGHAGRELTCLVSGSYHDGNALFQPGDLDDPGTDHDAPLSVIGDEPCLCVIGSEGLHLRGGLGWLQRLWLG